MKTLIILIIILINTSLFAHDVNYSNVIKRHWNISSEKRFIDGSFSMYRDGKVYIEEEDNKIVKIPLASLSIDDQNFVIAKYDHISKLNNQISLNQVESTNSINISYKLIIFLIIFSALSAYGIYFLDKKKRKYFITISAFGLLSVVYGFMMGGDVQIQSVTNPSFIDSSFAPFKPKVNTRWDANYFYVESKGIPDHPMMSGITGWQQQVPIPQCYIGSNAWSIPLNPVLATTPVPVNAQHFLRGAVAIAVNGIAIFNPYTNTGVDALLDGQLDQWGGHCGRADDYHYHIAPMILYNQTKSTLPIAFALDGFAVYGTKEPDGSDMNTLDANHGHFGSNGVYHYHGTKSAPYMIGNMVGKVTEDTTLQIIPQAAAKPIRPAGTPLKGAIINNCTPNSSNNGYILNYTLNSQNYSVDYSWDTKGNYTFKFISPTASTTSNYKGFVQCEVPTLVEDIITTNQELIIYPNPSKDALNLQLDNNILENDVKSISIYDLNGELMLKYLKFKTQIDISILSKGTYFLQLKIKNKEISKKFNIQ